MKIIITLTLLLLLWASNGNKGEQYARTNDFGMNKPHLLFHLGERNKVAVNYGFGFWHNKPKGKGQSNFSPLRMYYENTKNGLYVDMLNHDGDGHIHESIQDRTYGVEADIKYQMLDDGWEEHVHMIRSEKAKNSTASSYWLKFMTVENTDHNLIKVFDSATKTPKYLVLTEKEEKEATVRIDTMGQKSKEIFIKSSSPFKVFGFSMNISETYDVRGTMDEVKYLIELQRYKMKKRKNESEMVKWEDQQLSVMRENDWVGNKYVVLAFYGQFKEECDVFIGNRTKSFDEEHFEKVSKKLDQENFNNQLYSEHSQFLKHILYNLYGGIAFYQGGLYTQNSLIRHEFDYFYSFTPSRLIFPRGFLWDDGFHLSVAVHHKPSLVINILRNWIKKIDLFGWIGREQIRGFQMGSLMPQMKFIYQDTFEMNPPTLILPILTLIDKIKAGELHQSNVDKLNELLSQNFWKLQKWYRYFLKTQSHNNLMEKQYINKTTKFRWRCKDDCQRGNFMGSGLDDYPRVEQPNQLSKQHVDLMSWIFFFSEGLEKIANYLNQSKPASFYGKKKMEMAKKILDECLDKTDLIFKDQVVKAKNEFIDTLVTKIGYISLFPFFTGVLDDSLYKNEKEFSKEYRDKVREVRKKLVEVMMDPSQLLSEDGIRSLSFSDPLYGTLDNYWRGAVWMPINYLILRACKRHYAQDIQVQQLYETLRGKLTTSVKRNWEETGYLFENYYEGKGNRGYPFYGWSSLIAQIITEEY